MALDLNDKTANGNNLTNLNTTAEETTDLPFAASTSAANFSSATMALEAADSTSLSITSDLTIEVWVKKVAATDSVIFVAKRRTDNNQRSYGLSCSGEQVSFSTSADGVNNSNITQAGSASTGTNWTHLAGVYHASAQTVDLYRNGTAFETGIAGVAASIFDGTAKLTINGQDNGSGTPTSGTICRMDEVRIWNTALGSGAINSRWDKELAGTETGLVAYWPLEALSSQAAGLDTTSKMW